MNSILKMLSFLTIALITGAVILTIVIIIIIAVFATKVTPIFKIVTVNADTTVVRSSGDQLNPVVSITFPQNKIIGFYVAYTPPINAGPHSTVTAMYSLPIDGIFDGNPIIRVTPDWISFTTVSLLAVTDLANLMTITFDVTLNQ